MPRLRENIFFLSQPLIFTIEAGVPSTDNLPRTISTITIDETWIHSPIWNIQFGGILTISADITGEFILNFSLYKVGEVKELITTFSSSKQITTENLPEYSHIMFKHSIKDHLPQSMSKYRLELTSIASDATRNGELLVEGIIIGLADPQFYVPSV